MKGKKGNPQITQIKGKTSADSSIHSGMLSLFGLEGTLWQ